MRLIINCCLFCCLYATVVYFCSHIHANRSRLFITFLDLPNDLVGKGGKVEAFAALREEALMSHLSHEIPVDILQAGTTDVADVGDRNLPGILTFLLAEFVSVHDADLERCVDHIDLGLLHSDQTLLCPERGAQLFHVRWKTVTFRINLDRVDLNLIVARLAVAEA